MAVIGCDQVVAKLVVQVALPAVSVWALQPLIVTLLSLNVTLPVGVPEPGALALTVAVNVTDCAVWAGLLFDASAVVVASALIVCVSADEVEVV